MRSNLGSPVAALAAFLAAAWISGLGGTLLDTSERIAASADRPAAKSEAPAPAAETSTGGNTDRPADSVDRLLSLRQEVEPSEIARAKSELANRLASPVPTPGDAETSQAALGDPRPETAVAPPPAPAETAPAAPVIPFEPALAPPPAPPEAAQIAPLIPLEPAPAPTEVELAAGTPPGPVGNSEGQSQDGPNTASLETPQGADAPDAAQAAGGQPQSAATAPPAVAEDVAAEPRPPAPPARDDAEQRSADATGAIEGPEPDPETGILAQGDTDAPGEREPASAPGPGGRGLEAQLSGQMAALPPPSAPEPREWPVPAIEVQVGDQEEAPPPSPAELGTVPPDPPEGGGETAVIERRVALRWFAFDSAGADAAERLAGELRGDGWTVDAQVVSHPVQAGSVDYTQEALREDAERIKALVLKAMERDGPRSATVSVFRSGQASEAAAIEVWIPTATSEAALEQAPSVPALQGGAVAVPQRSLAGTPTRAEPAQPVGGEVRSGAPKSSRRGEPEDSLERPDARKLVVTREPREEAAKPEAPKSVVRREPGEEAARPQAPKAAASREPSEETAKPEAPRSVVRRERREEAARPEAPRSAARREAREATPRREPSRQQARPEPRPRPEAAPRPEPKEAAPRQSRQPAVARAPEPARPAARREASALRAEQPRPAPDPVPQLPPELLPSPN